MAGIPQAIKQKLLTEVQWGEEVMTKVSWFMVTAHQLMTMKSESDTASLPPNMSIRPVMAVSGTITSMRVGVRSTT